MQGRDGRGRWVAGSNCCSNDERASVGGRKAHTGGRRFHGRVLESERTLTATCEVEGAKV